jgi:hypothetical protein
MTITIGQGPNVNVSKLNDNQEETCVAIDSTNPMAVFVASKTHHGTYEGKFDPFINLPFIFTNHTPGLFAAYGNNSGGGWSGRILLTVGPDETSIGERSLPSGFTDPQAAFDDFGNLYLVYPSSIHQFGTATGGAGNTLTDTARQWAAGMWNGRVVVLRPGAGGLRPQEVQNITGNAANTLTVVGAWRNPPANGDSYEIVSSVTGGPVNGLAVLLSTNGGQSFQFLALLDVGTTVPIDYPAVATGPGRNANEKSVWLAWRSGNNKIVAAGAPVTAKGAVGPFTAPEPVNGSDGMATPRVAVGPNGQVMVAFCSVAHPGDTMVSIYTNVDDSGLNAQGLRATATKVADTTVLLNPHPPGFIIPAQPNLGIGPQVNLAWDRSGTYNPAPNGRVHLVYTYWFGGVDTDIAYSTSNNSGMSWSPWTNPWPNPSSQFLPAIAVDQTNGDVAVVWLDSRNDPANVKVQLSTVVSGDGGATWLGPYQVAQGQSDATRTSLPQQGTVTSVGMDGTITDATQNWTPNNYWMTNFQVFIPSTGESHPITASTATQLSIAPQTWTTPPAAGAAYQILLISPPNTVYMSDYGDYTGVAFYGGVFYPVWVDNSNSTNDNPNGTSGWLDLYTARLTVTRS